MMEQDARRPRRRERLLVDPVAVSKKKAASFARLDGAYLHVAMRTCDW